MMTLATRSWAAAFVPNTPPPDPPTGEVHTPTAAPAVAIGDEASLLGSVRWELGPVEMAGRLSIDHYLREKRLIAYTDVDFSSYIWQPWFIQLRAGLGIVGSRSSGPTDSGAPPDRASSTGLTGRLGVTVLPMSRFPFELRAEVGDSRTNTTFIDDQYRSARLSLSQAYRGTTGQDSYIFNLNHSRLQSDQWGNDTVTALSATASRQFGRHALEGTLSASQSERSDTGDTSTLKSISARHGFQAAQALRVDTLASWHDSTFALNGVRFGSDIRQLSSLATWRPQEGDWLHVDGSPIIVTGSARVLDAGFNAGDRTRGSQQLSGSLGAMVSVSRQTHVGLGVSGGTTNVDGGERTRSVIGTASLSHTPDALRWGEWRYGPSFAVAVNVGETTQLGRRAAVSTQLTHGLSRTYAFSGSSSLSLAASQSWGLLRESQTDVLARAVSHGLSASWQGSLSESSTSYVSASLSDSRNDGDARGRFQMGNVQITQRVQLTRRSSIHGSLTAQATRSELEHVDPFTGVIVAQSPGWQSFYVGSLTYENQRVFDVPRLRFSISGMVTTQQYERRIFGDVEAPRERISHHAEARFDYGIGRLSGNSGVRHTRAVDGRSTTAIFLRVQRNF